MSDIDEYGTLLYQRSDGSFSNYFVWAIVDPEIFKIDWVYYNKHNEVPLVGYKPCECKSKLKKAVLAHVQELIASYLETESQDPIGNEDYEVIDFNDIFITLSSNVTKLH